MKQENIDKNYTFIILFTKIKHYTMETFTFIKLELRETGKI